MTYEKPMVAISGVGTGEEITPDACLPGFAWAIAVAAAVWNVAGVYNYAGLVVAAAVVGVAFLVVGTGCSPS